MEQFSHWEIGLDKYAISWGAYGKPALFYLPDQIQIVCKNKKSEPISYSEDKVRISIFWSECNYRTWKNPVVLMVLV